MNDDCEVRTPKSCSIADISSEAAVRKVFALLGVDIDRPESVEEFREDLRFGRKLRKAADHGLLVMFGLVVAGIAAAIWAGVMSKIRGEH